MSSGVVLMDKALISNPLLDYNNSTLRVYLPMTDNTRDSTEDSQSFGNITFEPNAF